MKKKLINYGTKVKKKLRGTDSSPVMDDSTSSGAGFAQILEPHNFHNACMYLYTAHIIDSFIAVHNSSSGSVILNVSL